MKTLSKVSRPLITFVIVLFVICIGVIISARAESPVTYTVATGEALQTAINTAQSGDIVVLSNSITLTKSIKITNGRFFTIESPEGQLYSLIRGSSFTGDMIINNDSNVTYSRVIIDGNNVTAHGAAIDHICAGRTILTDGSKIINHKSDLMAAVVLLEGGYLELDANSGITGCSGPGGGAVYAAQGSVDVKSSGYITYCTTTGSGGAICAEGNVNNVYQVQIEAGADISHNQAGNGGAISATDGAIVTVSGDVKYNTATAKGGGLYANGAKVHLYGSSFQSNTAATNSNGSQTSPAVRYGQDVYITGSSAVVDMKGSVCIETELYLGIGVELNISGALSLLNSSNMIPISTEVNKGQYFPYSIIGTSYYNNATNGTLDSIQADFYAYSIDATPQHALFTMSYDQISNQIIASGEVTPATASNQYELKQLIAKAEPGKLTTIKVSSSILVTAPVDITGGRQILLTADSLKSIYHTPGVVMFRVVGNIFSNASLDTQSQLFLGNNITLGSTNSSDATPLVWAQAARFTMQSGSSIGLTASSPVQLSYSSQFVMNGGTISNTQGDGVVNMDIGSSFIMNDGRIQGCTGVNGGAVYVKGGTSFTMNGGKLYLNKAVCGGGVYVASGGTFNMTGGLLEENYVIYQDQNNAGGGVYIAANGTMTMSGGTFTRNISSIRGKAGNTGSWGGAMLVGGTLNISGGSISIAEDSSAAANYYYNDIAVSGGIINVTGDLSGSSKIDVYPVVTDTNTGHNVISYSSATYNTAQDGTGQFKFINPAVSITCADPYTSVVAAKVDLSSPVTWSALQAAINSAPVGVHTNIAVYNPDPKYGINYAYRENPNGSSIQVNSTVNITNGKDIEISYKSFDPSLLATGTNYDNANLMLRYTNDYGNISTFSGPLFSIDATSMLTLSNIKVSASLGLSSGATLILGQNATINNGALTVPSGVTMNFVNGSAEVNVSGTLNVTGGSPKVHILTGGTAYMAAGGIQVGDTAFDVQSGGTLNLSGGTITETNADASAISIASGGTANITGGTIKGPGKQDDKDNSPINSYTYNGSEVFNYWHGGCGINNKGTLNISGGYVSGFYTGILLNSSTQTTITITGCTVTGNMYGLSDVDVTALVAGADDTTIPVKVILDGCTITGNYQYTKTHHYNQAEVDKYFGGDIALGTSNVQTILDLSTGSSSTVGTIYANQERGNQYFLYPQSLPQLSLGGGSAVTGAIDYTKTMVTVASTLAGSTDRFTIAAGSGTQVVATATYTGGKGQDISSYFGSSSFMVKTASSQDGTLKFTWPTISPSLSLALKVDNSEVTSVAAGSSTVSCVLGIEQAATGTVTLYYDDHQGTETVTLDGQKSSYTASFSVPAVGKHTVYATYSGDATYIAATGTKVLTVTGVCTSAAEVQNIIDSTASGATATIEVSSGVNLDALVVGSNKKITLSGSANVLAAYDMLSQFSMTDVAYDTLMSMSFIMPLLFSSPEPTVTIYNTHNTTGAWITVEAGSTLTLDNVIMDGNADDAASDNAFVVNSGGTLELVNGAIIQNCRVLNNGGAVDVEGGTLTITSGTIRNNSAALGGGVYLNGGTLNIVSGQLYGNSAAYGGGIYAKSGTVNMTGGTIYSNKALTKGAGVFLKSTATYNMQGDATVLLTNAFYLDTSAYILVNGALTSTGSVAKIDMADAAAGTTVKFAEASYSSATGDDIAGFFVSRGGASLTTNGVNVKLAFGTKAYLAISFDKSSYTYGDEVTITATYPDNSTVPTGTITFYDGATSIGSHVLENKSAAYSFTPAAGSHDIYISYNGDSTYLPMIRTDSLTKQLTVSSATVSNGVQFSQATKPVTPSAGNTPITTAPMDSASTAQFTSSSISWFYTDATHLLDTAAASTFAPDKVYKAKFTLTPGSNYTFSGISASDLFSSSGYPTGSAITYAANASDSTKLDVVVTYPRTPSDQSAMTGAAAFTATYGAGNSTNNPTVTTSGTGASAQNPITYSVNIPQSTTNLTFSGLTLPAHATKSTLDTSPFNFGSNAGNKTGTLTAGSSYTYTYDVTAEDGTTKTYYKVALNVKASDAALSGTPTFDITVDQQTTNLDVTAGTEDATSEQNAKTFTLDIPMDATKLAVSGIQISQNSTAQYSYDAEFPFDLSSQGDLISGIDLAYGTEYTAHYIITAEDGLTKGYYDIVLKTPSRPVSGNKKQSDVQISVGGSTSATASATTEEGSDGRTSTTIIVDSSTLSDALSKISGDSTVAIPFTDKSARSIVQLSGQDIKSLDYRATVLMIQTPDITYTLPAAEINIDAVAEQLGSQGAMKDIKVSITIAQSNADTAKIIQDTANKNSYQVVVKPVDFSITCTSGDKTVEVSKFNGYVERTVAIPEGIDPSKIATGIVLNSDGTFSHVPTTIVVIGGKYYAKINSLTNSTYAVICNPVEFLDVTDHWAKAYVNDMGSRLIVSGVGGNSFEPDRDITRAEFAAIIVRALGLQPGTGAASFSDIKDTDWFSGYIRTAAEYDLIKGYTDGTVKPNAMITREEAMAIIARAMKLTGLRTEFSAEELSEALKGFVDVKDVGVWATDAVGACVLDSLVSGKADQRLAPKDEITRAEVAVLVQRLLKASELI